MVRKHPRGFSHIRVETSRDGESETGPERANPRKYYVETQTGRRFEASACWYNRRVKLSSISLIQLPVQNSALAHRKFSGYHPRLITQRFSRELRAKTLRSGLVAVGKIRKDVSFLARYTAEQWPALINFVPSVLHPHH